MAAKVTPITGKKVQRRYFFNAGKSKQLLQMFVDHYDAQQGSDNKRYIKSAKLLADKLLELYASTFAIWQEENDFQVELEHGRLPLLQVNNAFLARQLRKSKRTIQNYREKLAEAGFLLPVRELPGNRQYSVNHGRTSDYELLINPKFFYIQSSLHQRRVPVRGVAHFFDVTQNFRPTSTSTAGNQLEQTRTTRTISGKKDQNPADSRLEQQEQSGKQQEPSSKRQEPKNENGQSSQQAGADATGTGEKGRPAAEKNATISAEEEARRRGMIEGYSMALFNAAKGWLYSGEYFTETESRLIALQICDFFGDAPESKLLKISNHYRHRLKLIQLHWHKHHGELPPAREFFDVNNPDGFRKARGWVNDPEKYPPPQRKTYRLARMMSRGDTRRGSPTELRDIL